MEALKAILSRRSIRKYTNEPVSDGQINEILKAAMAAPSAGNQQPWEFVVLTDRNVMDKVPVLHPNASMILEAPLAIAVCGNLEIESHKGYWMQDCAAAVENILIAVNALGLGAVWTGVYPREDRVKGLSKLLALPSHIIPLALIIIGHPDETKPPADRFDKKRLHYNKW
jgi:nitroreductase